ncbi:UDP-N-acetylmuramoyl-L-alanine--D-glutamate ligase [Pelagibacterales bacterium SAG-MED22]|nr:UDP-N-acetylmuramoyl-L-alanine--D-glutamate ligase [Pelagibacterales bacterium SAG-MED22]
MKKINNIFLKKKILIYGLGKSGISTYNFLKHKAQIKLFDDNPKNDPKFTKRSLSFNKILKSKFDFIIISPGIDFSKCRLAKYLKQNLSKVHTDLDVFCSFFSNDSVTITGTNGKSTTAKLLYDVLKNQKKDARLVGNIGNPILLEKKITKKTFFVIEASSYQLEYSKIFKSKYSVILNITPDHIERHKSFKNYIQAKFRLLDAQCTKSVAFVKRNDPVIIKKLKSKNYKQKIIKIDTSLQPPIFKNIRNKYFMSSGNTENLIFVLKICKILKINEKKILRTINKFKGLKYRQQIIFVNNYLTVINDSKSTSLASSENLLKNLKNVYWILCGIPKKRDKFNLTKFQCKNFKGYIFGKYQIQFSKILENKLIIKKFKNLKDTLNQIFLEIKYNKGEKNTILFSPAGASFDNFKNFEDRGLYFNQIIKKYLNEK